MLHSAVQNMAVFNLLGAHRLLENSKVLSEQLDSSRHKDQRDPPSHDCGHPPPRRAGGGVAGLHRGWTGRTTDLDRPESKARTDFARCR